MASSFRERYGPWALVTGASSGIGAEFARHLGSLGFNLVLVARRVTRLQALAQEITGAHGCEVRSVECDLGSAQVLETLRPHLADLDLGLLVNNAGFANTGAVVDNDLEHELQLLHVNCRAYLTLSHEVGRRLAARGRGGIILVSSTMAFTPAALWAHYSASKAYALALGEAMHDEMRPRGVDVLAVCPGPSRTGLYESADQDLSRVPAMFRPFLVEPQQVVTTALGSLGRKRSVVVGWPNKAAQLMTRFVPRSMPSRNVATFVAAVRRRPPGSGESD